MGLQNRLSRLSKAKHKEPSSFRLNKRHDKSAEKPVLGLGRGRFSPLIAPVLAAFGRF